MKNIIQGILFLICFSLSSCDKEKSITSKIDLPQVSNNVRIDKLEYNIPINVTYKNEKAQCWVDEKRTRIDSLQNAVYDYLKRNEDLVESLKDNDYGIQPILSADKNTPYLFIHSIFAELGQLDFDSVIIKCEDLDSKVISLKEKVFVPFDEVYTHLCKKNGWRKKMNRFYIIDPVTKESYWDLSYDTTIHLINFYEEFFYKPDENEEEKYIEQIPRASEPPPPPPPPPISLEWNFSNGKRWLIDLKITIESGRMDINQVQTDSINLIKSLSDYLEKEQIKREETKDKEDEFDNYLTVFLFISDDISFEYYLKIKNLIYQEIIKNGFDPYLRYSSMYEKEVIETLEKNSMN